MASVVLSRFQSVIICLVVPRYNPDNNHEIGIQLYI